MMRNDECILQQHSMYACHMQGLLQCSSVNSEQRQYQTSANIVMKIYNQSCLIPTIVIVFIVMPPITLSEIQSTCQIRQLQTQLGFKTLYYNGGMTYNNMPTCQ